MTSSTLPPTPMPRRTKNAVIWHHQDRPDPQMNDVVNLLHRKGYEVVFFANEYEITRNVIAPEADLLLIHLQTAGERGYDLCRALRQQTMTTYLPIVFVGSRGEKSERVGALRCGGNEYLKLPLDEEEGWLRLEQHLNTAQLVRQLQADRVDLSQKVGEYSHILAQQEQLKRSLAEENQALHKMAFIDGLTQVANRRSFNQNIAQRWQTALSQHQPISLLLCDIDHFKRYNDTYGHLAGDACLRSVAAALMRGAHRYQDQVSRYGGEEFAILLPGTDAKGAEQVALAVQSELAQLQIPHRASLVKPWVSLSVGVCTIVPEYPDESCERLIYGADKALYTAKLRGRDRTVINTFSELRSMECNYCLCDYTISLETLQTARSPSVLSNPPYQAHHKHSLNQYQAHLTCVPDKSADAVNDCNHAPADHLLSSVLTPLTQPIHQPTSRPG